MYSITFFIYTSISISYLEGSHHFITPIGVVAGVWRQRLALSIWPTWVGFTWREAESSLWNAVLLNKDRSMGNVQNRDSYIKLRSCFLPHIVILTHRPHFKQYVISSKAEHFFKIWFGNWFFMTPSIATKFQYLNSLLFSFSLTTCFGPYRPSSWEIYN
jgi:hypothetical protein